MDDNEQYAKLLASIKIANTGLRRPLSPFETAQFIQRLIDEEGYELAEELIPIKTKLISDFLQLLKLPEQCHDAKNDFSLPVKYKFGLSKIRLIVILKHFFPITIIPKLLNCAFSPIKEL